MKIKQKTVYTLIFSFFLIFLLHMSVNGIRRHIYLLQIKDIKNGYTQFLKEMNGNPHLFNDSEKVEFFEKMSWLYAAESGEIEKIGHLDFIVNLTETFLFCCQNELYYKKDVYEELKNQKNEPIQKNKYMSLHNDAVENDKKWLRGNLYSYIKNDNGFVYYNYTVRRYSLEEGKLHPCSYKEALLQKNSGSMGTAHPTRYRKH